MTSTGRAAPPGLTTAEAQRRLASDGPNDLGAIRRGSGNLRQILVALVNPLVLLLLAAGAVSAVLGQLVNAVLIASMVLLSVTLNFVQTGSSSSSPGVTAPARGHPRCK
jgi:Mg2+-importing ATPase